DLRWCKLHYGCPSGTPFQNAPAEDTVAELDGHAQAHFGCWFEENLPHPCLQFVQEQHFRFATCAHFPTAQTCWYHFGIIDHQHITGVQIVANVGESTVGHTLPGTIHYHQASLIASGCGNLRNQLWW